MTKPVQPVQDPAAPQEQQQIQMTLQHAINHMSNRTVPVEERFESAIAIIAQLLGRMGTQEQGLQAMAANLHIAEGFSFSAVRELVQAHRGPDYEPDEPEVSIIDTIRDGAATFATMAAERPVTLWSWMEGAKLEHVSEDILRANNERRMKEAMESGEVIEEGVCLRKDGCETSEVCTNAGRCVGADKPNGD